MTEQNTIYFFIDASNTWEAMKAKGRFLDFKKTIENIKNQLNGQNIKVFYYTAYPKEGTRSYNLDPKHKFFTFLKKGLGFEVRKKELKRINIINKELIEKGNMDVEITIDAIWCFNKYNTAVFFTGDSDFLALIKHLRLHDKKVFIFSSENNISQELRFGSDGYFDILDINNIWGGKLKYRSELERGT